MKYLILFFSLLASVAFAGNTPVNNPLLTGSSSVPSTAYLNLVTSGTGGLYINGVPIASFVMSSTSAFATASGTSNYTNGLTTSGSNAVLATGSGSFVAKLNGSGTNTVLLSSTMNGLTTVTGTAQSADTTSMVLDYVNGAMTTGTTFTLYGAGSSVGSGSVNLVGFRATGNPIWMTGKGTEIGYDTLNDNGVTVCYDRDGSVFKPYFFYTESATFLSNGTPTAKISTAGIEMLNGASYILSTGSAAFLFDGTPYYPHDVAGTLTFTTSP